MPHDKERSIEGQSIIHSMGYNMDHKWLFELSDEEREGYLVDVFDILATKLDDYAGIKEPLKSSISVPAPSREDYENITGKNPGLQNLHLSDERVAAGVAREGQRPLPESRVTSPLKDVLGFVEDTSIKEYKKGKFMFGIKIENQWYTTFYRVHYDFATESREVGAQVRILYDPTPYKGKPSRTVQSIDPI